MTEQSKNVIKLSPPASLDLDPAKCPVHHVDWAKVTLVHDLDDDVALRATCRYCGLACTFAIGHDDFSWDDEMWSLPEELLEEERLKKEMIE
ncbi:MAG: hypothetical protein ACTSYX_01275 [Candidatus Thorarchaeota archaeon]